MGIWYWSLEEAIKELKKRQLNSGLRGSIEKKYKIHDFLPQLLSVREPCGFLGRHMAAARLEEIQFYDRCLKSGLKPIWLIYLEDKFHPGNPSKMRLAKVCISLGEGKKGGNKEKVFKILHHTQWGGGSSMSDLKTCWGENLATFHQQVLKEVLGKVEISLIDLSAWLKNFGKAVCYYEPYLSLAITHGILFESFESPGFRDLEEFKNAVVLPAYQKLRVEWGMEPLIVYHPHLDSEKNESFLLNYYDPKILEFIPPQRR